MTKGERHRYGQPGVEMDDEFYRRIPGWIRTNKTLQCSVALCGYIHDTREIITALLLCLVLFPHPQVSRSVIVSVQS